MPRTKGPKKVAAYQGYGVYADYDANAPDTENLILVATEKLAEEVCARLNENPRAFGQLAYVEGYEYCKSFQFRRAFSTRRSDFAITIEQAFEDVEESEDESDG